MSRFSKLFILGPGWALLLYLIVAQGIAAINYDLGIAMGTQEPSSVITDAGVAFFKGFAMADLLIYIPLLLIGLIGHARSKAWGRLPLIAALGITVYWPVTCLRAVIAADGARGWNLPPDKVLSYWIVLTLIAFWGAIALLILADDK